MSHEVTTSHISGRQALTAVRKLGPLAPLVLKPSVLAAARGEIQRTGQEAIDKTSLDFQPIQVPGLAMLLYARKCENDFVDDAFVLPVKWQRSASDHSDILPDELKKVANVAVDIFFSKTDPPTSEQWSLQPHFNKSFYETFWQVLHPETSYAAFPSESAFATLFATLYLASWGAPPVAVWASAAFDPMNGLRAVESAGLKAKLAERLGTCAGQQPKFFVHPENADEVKAVAPQVDLKMFAPPHDGYSKTPRDQVLAAVEPLLHMLDAPLDISKGVDACVTYWKRCMDRGNTGAAKEYYREVLHTQTIDKIRQDWTLKTSRSPSHLHLIGFVERDKRDQFNLLAEALKLPQKRQLQILCEGNGLVNFSEPELRLPTDIKDQISVIARHIRDTMQEYWPITDPTDFIFDLTAGTKLMTAAVLEVLAPGNLICYLSHKMYGRLQRLPEPGTTVLLLWRKRKDGKLEPMDDARAFPTGHT